MRVFKAVPKSFDLVESLQKLLVLDVVFHEVCECLLSC